MTLLYKFKCEKTISTDHVLPNISRFRHLDLIKTQSTKISELKLYLVFTLLGLYFCSLFQPICKYKKFNSLKLLLLLFLLLLV